MTIPAAARRTKPFSRRPVISAQLERDRSEMLSPHTANSNLIQFRADRRGRSKAVDRDKGRRQVKALADRQ